MTDNTSKAVKPGNVDEAAQTWAIEDIKAIEVQIGTDLGSAGHLLILGVTAKFYAVTGDKDGATWVRRVMAGTGFTFDRKRRTDGELSARDQAVVALLRDGASLTDVADTLGIGVATVHKIKTDNGEASKGGTKTGAGRVATAKPSATATPATPAATDAPAAPVKRMADPVLAVFAGIDRIGTDADPERAADGWAIVYAYLIETSGYDAATLAARAAKLASEGKALSAE